MKPQLRSFLLIASLLFAPIAADPIAGEETASPGIEGQEEIILQILELRQQIEDLLAALPPEVRQEVERRWQERQATPAVEATASSLPSEAVPLGQPESPTDIVAEASPPCGGFHLLDTNGDGLVSGGDRQWRFLRLWFDNGDGILEETELESLFELGVRQIDVDLRFYTNEDGDSEDVDAGELIELAQVGKGKSPRRTGVLVIDSDRLAREGILIVLGPETGQLSDYQPLGSESFLADEAGNRFPVICPDLD